MEAYLEYYLNLNRKYGVDAYSYVEETTIFLGFMRQILALETDEAIPETEKQQIRAFLTLTDGFLAGEITLDALSKARIRCWEKHTETMRTHLRANGYYRIIVVFLSGRSMKDDPASQFMPFEFFLMLLEEVDEAYLPLFCEYMGKMANKGIV